MRNILPTLMGIFSLYSIHHPYPHRIRRIRNPSRMRLMRYRHMLCNRRRRSRGTNRIGTNRVWTGDRNRRFGSAMGRLLPIPSCNATVRIGARYAHFVRLYRQYLQVPHGRTAAGEVFVRHHHQRSQCRHTRTYTPRDGPIQCQTHAQRRHRTQRIPFTSPYQSHGGGSGSDTLLRKESAQRHRHTGTERRPLHVPGG